MSPPGRRNYRIQRQTSAMSTKRLRPAPLVAHCAPADALRCRLVRRGLLQTTVWSEPCATASLSDGTDVSS